MKTIFFFSLISLLISCNGSITSNSDDVTNDKKQIEFFNKIFKKTEINGRYYKINKVKPVFPAFDINYITKEDTANLVFYELFEDTDSFIIGVNKELCYAFILVHYNGFYYPHNYAIYPGNFKLLDDELFSCENDDVLEYRELSFDKNLLGKWLIDSIEFETNETVDIKEIFPTKNYVFYKDSLCLDDSLNYGSYELSGFNIIINDDLSFFRIYSSVNKMIIYKYLNDGGAIYFLSKQMEN